jgi:chorismate lyase/3-hydroxybenzoate synthase
MSATRIQTGSPDRNIPGRRIYIPAMIAYPSCDSGPDSACDSDVSDGSVLADIRFGHRHDRDAADPRRIRIATPPIGVTPDREVWRLPQTVTAGWSGDVGYACGGDFLFAHLLLEGSAGTDLTRLTAQAYEQLLAFLRDAGFPHPLRIWNYMSRINDEEMGLERYQAFCRGRADAFAQAAIPERAFPAATAIGCEASGLSIHLLAGRGAGLPIGNPRQISAYRYPPAYGPRPPSFARALCYRGPYGALELTISGTASIVGHVTMHPGEPMRQTRETIRNLRSLVEHARIAPRRSDQGPPALLKVYLRDPNRVREIDTLLRAWTRGRSKIMYLHGTICRRDLEIEIEGHDSVSPRYDGDLHPDVQAEKREARPCINRR